MKEEKKKRRLFLGPFQPELEGAFFDFVKNEKNRDPLAPLVVLVGSNLMGLYLRRLFAQGGLNHMNIRFLTFFFYYLDRFLRFSFGRNQRVFFGTRRRSSFRLGFP
ncbi:MAG: hypothetical protein ABSB32_02785 [Thermodesulfobacteriota bacterium]